MLVRIAFWKYRVYHEIETVSGWIQRVWYGDKLNCQKTKSLTMHRCVKHRLFIETLIRMGKFFFARAQCTLSKTLSCRLIVMCVLIFLFCFFFPDFFSSYRFINDYSNFPADYAEVSTFSKAPSECSGTRSPAPYATTTLVGNSRLITVKNVNNQNMYFASDLYNPQNRYVHSESYFNPKEKINITENRLGCNTFNPNHVTAMASNTPFGTIRKNRLKLLRNPHFRIGQSDGKLNDSNDSNGNLTNSNANGQQEQLYVKIGEMNPTSSEYDYSGIRWATQQQQQHQQSIDQYHHQRPMQQHYEQSSQAMQQQTPQSNNGSSNQSIYENHHRQNSDKDMIYAPSANRSIISYMSSNKRFDEV